MKQRRFDKSILASVFMMLAMFIASCSHDSLEQSDVVTGRNETPAVISDNVQTLISDSGITRYRIESPTWLVYDYS